MSAAGSVINPVFRSEYLNLLPMAGDVAVYQRLLIGRIVSHERSAVRIRRRRWSPAIRVDIHFGHKRRGKLAFSPSQQTIGRPDARGARVDQDP